MVQVGVVRVTLPKYAEEQGDTSQRQITSECPNPAVAEGSDGPPSYSTLPSRPPSVFRFRRSVVLDAMEQVKEIQNIVTESSEARTHPAEQGELDPIVYEHHEDWATLKHLDKIINEPDVDVIELSPPPKYVRAEQPYEQYVRVEPPAQGSEIVKQSQRTGQETADTEKITEASEYRKHGYDYFNQGNYEQAEEHFSQALNLHPDSPVALYNRGVSRDLLGKYDQALADLTKAIELAPDFTPAYSARALIYETIGDHNRAIADHETVLESSSDSEIGLLAKKQLDHIRRRIIELDEDNPNLPSGHAKTLSLESLDSEDKRKGSPPSSPPPPPNNNGRELLPEDEGPEGGIDWVTEEELHTHQQAIQQSREGLSNRELIESTKKFLSSQLHNLTPDEFGYWFTGRGDVWGRSTEWGERAVAEWLQEDPEHFRRFKEAFEPDIAEFRNNLDFISKMKPDTPEQRQVAIDVTSRIIERQYLQLSKRVKAVPQLEGFRELLDKTERILKWVKTVRGARIAP